MAYILGLVVVILLSLALHYFTELTKMQKISVASFVLAIVFSAIAYNKYSTSQREKMLSVVMKFHQHKNVECNGIKVNDTNFTISIGTYTFIGKKDTPNYTQMISVSECN